MELLSQYGNEMSLIDTTYKTAKYDLPLYTVVLEIIAQYKQMRKMRVAE